MSARPARARPLRRTLAMARKEATHVLRDPASLYLAFGMPVVLIVLFGYGVSFDLDHTPVSVVDQARTPESRQIVRALGATGEFDVREALWDPARVEQSFAQGRSAAALVVPPDLSERLARGEPAPLQILLDGSDGTSASAVLGAATALVGEQGRRLQSQLGVAPPIGARTTLLYNPALRSQLFFVPGLIAWVMAIAAVLMTALTVAREWERGNMEQLFATPVRRLEILLGKLLPFLAIGMLQALLVLVVGCLVFDVPVRGSLLVLGSATLLFLIGMLGQGLLLSVVTRSQQLATQVGAISTLLPTLLLSGFLFPIENMPVVLQWLSRVFPARYFMAVLRGVLLKGNGLDVLWPDFVGMAVFALVVFTVATKRFVRRVA